MSDIISIFPHILAAFSDSKKVERKFETILRYVKENIKTPSKKQLSEDVQNALKLGVRMKILSVRENTYKLDIGQQAAKSSEAAESVSPSEVLGYCYRCYDGELIDRTEQFLSQVQKRSATRSRSKRRAAK